MPFGFKHSSKVPGVFGSRAKLEAEVVRLRVLGSQKVGGGVGGALVVERPLGVEGRHVVLVKLLSVGGEQNLNKLQVRICDAWFYLLFMRG